MDSPVTWIFSGVGITIVLGVFYLVKRYCYHLKFEPVIKVVGHNEETIVLRQFKAADFSKILSDAVSAEDKRLPKYNITNLDPFLNPWLMTPYGQVQTQNQQHYMGQRSQYLNSFRTYQSHVFTEEEDKKAMVGLPLIIENRGRAQGNNIEIELTLMGMFYGESNKLSHQATRIKQPIDIGQNNMSVVFTQLSQDSYTYQQWDLKTPLSSPLCFRKSHMNPQGADKEPFAVLYVNTREKADLSIHWKVYESSLPNPIEGDVFISVE